MMNLSYGTIILTILTPISCYVTIGGNKIIGITIIRILMGALSGLAMAAPQSFWVNWAPKDERGILTGGAYSGTVLGFTREFDQ